MLYIVYPDVFFKGVPIDLSGNKRKVVTGQRKSSYSENTTAMNFSSSNLTPQQPDICILAQAHYNVVRDSDPRLIITGANDVGFGADTVSFEGDYSASDLVGAGSEDYIFEFTSAAKTCWRARLQTSTQVEQKISKVYLGSKLDLGRQPTAESSVSYDLDSQSAARPLREIKLVYESVSKSRYLALRESVIKYKATNPVFLYAKTNQQVLNGATLIHAMLESVTVRSKMVDRFSFDLLFREII